MLFDLTGKRKRFLQIIFGLLALVFTISFVGFGIGSDAGGGLFDAVGVGGGQGGGGGNSPRNPQYEQQIEEAEALLACARDCGLFVLLEAFDVDDLTRIAGLTGPLLAPEQAPVLCGVNCRDLKTLAVDFDRFAALTEHLPAGLTAVAESGILGIEEVRAVAQMGYQAVLVGSILMQSQQPAQAIAELTAAGAQRQSCS